MIEDLEFNNPNEGSNTESCVSGHITRDKKETEYRDLLEEPIVKKIKELFDIENKDIKYILKFNVYM